jgi:hypothetical protein
VNLSQLGNILLSLNHKRTKAISAELHGKQKNNYRNKTGILAKT